MNMELRQTKNKFVLNGTLAEKVVNYGVKDGINTIGLTLTVETDNGTYEVRGYQKETTKSGKENGLYKSFETIANDYVAMKETFIDRTSDGEPTSVEKTNDRESATYVSINCDIRENNFMSKNGQLVEGFGYQLTSAHRISDVNKAEYPAGFKGELEGCVGAITDEVENGVETGRVGLLLYVVAYGGKIIPVPIAIDSEIAEAVKSIYEKGDTVRLDVELLPHTVGKVVEEKPASAFSKANVETAHFVEGYTRTEFNCIAGDPAETDGDLKLNPQLIGEAIKERENRLTELKNSNKKTTNTTPMAQMKTSDVDLDDIPF